MSIAEQERQINQIVEGSKERLRGVEDKLNMLGNQKLSIDEDITILSQRVEVIRERMRLKKQVLKSVTALTAQSEQNYRKLKESTKMLLVGLKKQCKKADLILNGSPTNNEDGQSKE